MIYDYEQKYDIYFGEDGIDVDSLLSIYPKTKTLNIISSYLHLMGEQNSVIKILLEKYFGEDIEIDNL